MTRITTADFLNAAYSDETDVVLILLMTITHDDLDSPIYLSTDPTERLSVADDEITYGTTSNGTDFSFLPIQLVLPDESDAGPSNMKITMDNIHRDLIPTLRSITTPPSFNVDIVLSSDVDTVIGSWDNYLLTNIQYNAEQITGTLVLESLTSEPYPAGTFTPAYFPGLF